MMGTPAYMAPEQAAGRTKQIDARTDVYGLGVLLFEALTGELPFAGGAIATIRGIMEDDPPSLRSLRRGIPAGLERVILKALAKDRADRFQTAAEMAAALRAGTAGRVRKRRRYGVGLAVALAVALLAAAAGMTIRETSTALSVDEVNHQAALLRTEARELLYAARPVADDRARIESWSERSKRLRGVSKRGSNARSAVEQGEADIAALQGLLALESGERVAALRRQKDVERVRDTDGIAALAIAGSVSAITTRDDPLKAAETLDAAIAAGVARPELLGWRAHANLRHALAKFRQGDYSGAIAVVGSANHQAIRARTRHAVLTEARREISLGARALSRLGRDEKAPRDDMARLRAQLFFLHAVCPAEPVSPEGLKELMTLATHPRRTLSLEFEFQLADMYQDDFEVQRAMAKRIIFAGGDTARHRAASRRFAPIAKRAATLAPNREEELRHLELHGDMLVDGLQYVAGMKLANELLTQTDLSQRLRAKCHFWRSNRLSTLHKSKEAIVEADKALALDGTLLRCHFRRSKALQRLKQWDGALRASLVYVRETDPHIAQNSFSWYHRSVTRAFECSRKISKPYAYDLSAEAIVAMLDVRNQAYFAGWWVRLGFVQLRAGRVDAAISSLETAVSRLPGNPPHFAIMKCKLLEKCKPLLKAVREKGVDATGAYRKVINHLETVRAGEVLP